MKKISYFLLIPLFFGIFQSCNNTDKDSYEEWRVENEKFIEEIKNDFSFLQATVPQGPGTVYYKVLQTPEGGNEVCPIYTSKVKVHYKGSLINGTVFDDASNRTVELSVNGVVKGFAVALQNMQVGAKWKIYIPWELGYGYSSSGLILPYSALIFELELIEISEY